MNPAVRLLLLSGRRMPVTQLLAVSSGNSIAAQSQFLFAGSSAWTFRSEMQLANCLAGSPMRFGLVTPRNVRTDEYGAYGYSGATLDTINADIPATWIAQVNAAQSNPDLAVGLALLENDIAAGASVQDMMSRVDTWIGIVRSAWPRAIIWLCTPRPSFSYDTGAKVLAYQSMRDFILSKDNGRTTFVSRLDGYENGSTGQPLAGYTDATVHPNANGALVNARVMAATLMRMGGKSVIYPGTSNNQFLSGTAAASGTNVTGTVPTSCTVTGSANGSFTTTANQPGWTIQFSTPVGGTNLDISTFDTGAKAATPSLVSAYMRLQILSGAANLRAIQMEPRLQDSGGNTFRLHLSSQSTDPDLDYLDGDVWTFTSPPMAPNSGAFSALRHYIRPKMKNTTGATTIQVIESGFYAVQ